MGPPVSQIRASDGGANHPLLEGLKSPGHALLVRVRVSAQEQQGDKADQPPVAPLARPSWAHGSPPCSSCEQVRRGLMGPIDDGFGAPSCGIAVRDLALRTTEESISAVVGAYGDVEVV